MTWNDMRNPDRIPAVADPVEKLLRENEIRGSLVVWRLSRPEMVKEFYPETRCRLFDISFAA